MKLSIIIPVYNAENNIEQLLDLIVEQYTQDIEIILVDDGSTDSSYKICKKFEEIHKFIKTISQKNSGVSCARNTALDKASGEYIVFVDSDDTITDTYISDILELCKLNMDLIQMDWFSGNFVEGYNLQTVNLLEGDIDYESYMKCIVQQKSNAPWNKIYRRSIIEENKLRFDTNMCVGEDINFTIQFMLYTKKIYISKRAAYKYYINPNGLCGNVNPSYLYDNNKLYNNIVKVIEIAGDKYELHQELLKGMLRMAFRTIGSCMKKGYRKKEINEAMITSGIKIILGNVKCDNAQDLLRLCLINMKAYKLISILTKDRG